MSAASHGGAPPPAGPLPRALAPLAGSPPIWDPGAVAARWRQARAVFGLELLRLRRTRLGLGLFALLSTVLFVGVAPLFNLLLSARSGALFSDPLMTRAGAVSARETLAGAGQPLLSFLIAVVIYLMAFVIFAGVLRGELAARTLHLLLLQPVRREVVIAGKFGAAVLAVAGVATAGVVLGALVRVVPHGPGAAVAVLSMEFLVLVAGWTVVVTAATAAYGALFLFAGAVLRGPTKVAIALWGWERLLPQLPAPLRPFSIAHHVQALEPGANSPTSPLVAALVLAILVAAFLVATMLVLRRLEPVGGASE